MAWIYLAESEECQSRCENGLDQSLIAKSIPIVKEFSCQTYQIEKSKMLQSGIILQRCNQIIFFQQSISSMEDSPVRILALQDMEKAWSESEADYFSRSFAWPKKSSPLSYSLKMFPPSHVEEGLKLLDKLPKWGMTVDGVLYPLLPLERGIKEIAGSYWLTPCTMDHLPVRKGEALENALHTGKNRISRRKVSGRLNEQVAYPIMWPTPDSSARGAYKDQEKRKGHHFTIQDAVGSGKLNPTWIEWLMRYNSGHTELEPWAMQWYLLRRKRHSKF